MIDDVTAAVLEEFQVFLGLAIGAGELDDKNVQALAQLRGGQAGLRLVIPQRVADTFRMRPVAGSSVVMMPPLCNQKVSFPMLIGGSP